MLRTVRRIFLVPLCAVAPLGCAVQEEQVPDIHNKLTRLGVEQGFASAQYILGRMYANGERAVRAGAAVGVAVRGSPPALSIERVMRDGHLVTARV